MGWGHGGEGAAESSVMIPRSVRKLPAAAAAVSSGKLPAPPPLLTFTENTLKHLQAEKAAGIVSGITALESVCKQRWRE